MRTIPAFVTVFLLFLMLLTGAAAFRAGPSGRISLKSREIIPYSPGIPGRARSAMGIMQAEPRSAPEKAHLLIQLGHIPGESEKLELEDDGIRLLDYIPERAWFASVEDPSALAGHDITYAGEILPGDKIAPGIPYDGEAKLSVLFFSDVSMDEIRALIEKYGEVLEEPKSGAWIIRIPGSMVRALAGEDSVKWLEQAYRPRTTLNDESRSVIGVDAVQGAPYNLSGAGVVLAEWDEGYASHSDYGSRTAIGDPGEGSTNSHATHVAGTMLGDGSLSESEGGTPFQWKGMAPNASLVTYEWPDDIGETYEETNHSIAVYDAVLSQNSWGEDVHDDCSRLGDYDSWSYAYDNIVNGNASVVDRAMTMVFAAGNERNTGLHGGCAYGEYYCGAPSQGGHTYNTTIGPGGTAKNTITVGAVDKSESMSSFSSWGPTDDGRLKPDVVAVGVTVKSAYPTDTYSTMSGTSMAAPAVSGAVGLIHEEYRSTHSNADPTPSTVKALLIHTAKDLNDTGPDYTTGWGLVNATEAIDKVREDTNGTEVIMEGSLSNGENRTYRLLVSGQSELKLTLVWDDYPGTPNAGKELVNDLDLIVLNSTGSRFYPWTLDPGNPADPPVNGSADDRNNAEQVRVFNPGDGVWTVTVNGTSVPEGPEDYSLISTNDFGIPVVTPEYPDNGFVSGEQSIGFNCSATDNYGLSNATLYTNISGWAPNETNAMTGFSNHSVWNLTGISDGEYVWNCLVYNNLSNPNWSSQNRTFTIAAPPEWSGNSSDAVAAYSPSGISSFNVTWSDNTAMATVLIEGNWSGSPWNYTMGNVSGNYSYSAVLPAGDFYWKSYASDASGNMNVSDTWAFSIGKADSGLELLLNGTGGNLSADEDSYLNITANLNLTDTVSLYVNGSLYGSGAAPLENVSLFPEPGLYNASAYYNGSQNYTANSSTHWLEVNDTTHPEITVPWVFPPLILPGENVSISASVADFNLSGVWYNISNATPVTGDIPNTAGCIYNASYNTTNLSLGTYNVTIYANDSGGRESNATVDFEISAPKNISLYVLDNQNNPANASGIYIIYNKTGGVRNESWENVSQFDSIVPGGFWNIKASAPEFNLTLSDVNVTENMTGNVTMDYNISAGSLTAPAGTRNFTKTIATDTGMNFTKASIEIAYDDSLLNDSHVGVYACHDWNLSGRACLGSWENVTGNSSTDTGNDTVTVNTSSLSAFSVAQEKYCGDGIIDPGESCDGSNITQGCPDYGYSSGSVSCTPSCTPDTGACYSPASSPRSGGGGAVSRKEIVIAGYPSVLSAGKGKSRAFTVTLNNTGDTGLTNVTLSLESTCTGCIFRAEPENISIPEGEAGEFSVTLEVPESQKTGEFTADITASTKEGAGDRKSMSLTILDCSPGEKRCAGDTIQECTPAGEWARVTECERGCSGGACISGEGLCTPGETRCTENKVLVCSPGGDEWFFRALCAHGCSGGACNPGPGPDWRIIPALIMVALVLLAFRLKLGRILRALGRGKKARFDFRIEHR